MIIVIETGDESTQYVSMTVQDFHMEEYVEYQGLHARAYTLRDPKVHQKILNRVKNASD